MVWCWDLPTIGTVLFVPRIAGYRKSRMTSDPQDHQQNQSYRIYDAADIGNALRHFRHAAGVSQNDLARQTGIPREYLIAMEHGLETEQVRRLLRLLKALDAGITIGHRTT
jgi:DNA-binding XRE family transcriptional regulator